MWHVAFWEWIGSVIFFMFMVVTVLLLPDGIKAPAIIVPVRVQLGQFIDQSDGETRTLVG